MRLSLLKQPGTLQVNPPDFLAPDAILDQWLQLPELFARVTSSCKWAYLQLAIYMVQDRYAGMQKSHWDKADKENYHLKLCMPFIYEWIFLC